MKSTSLTDAAATLQAEITRIREAEETLRARHAEATRELDRIVQSLPPADELLDTAFRLVDQVAANPTDFNVYPSTGLRDLAGGARLSFRGMEISHAPTLPEFAHAQFGFKTIAAVAPSLAKQMLSQFVERHAPADAIPSQDKPAMVARQQDLIRTIEDEHAQLIDLANANGLNMQHLPAVKARRDQAAREEQLSTETRAYRAQLSAKADAANPQL